MSAHRWGRPLSTVALFWATAAAGCAPAQSPAPPPAPPPVALPAASAAPVQPAPAPTVDESFRVRAPDPAPAVPFVPPAPTRAELRDHVPVFVVEQPSPYVAIRVVAALEPGDFAPDHREVVDVLGRSMYQGTTSRTRRQIEDALMAMRAAPLELLVHPDAITVTVVAPARELRAAAELVADVVLRPALDKAQLERGREQHARARESEAENSSLVAARVLGRVLFGNTWYGTTAGTPAQVRAVRREEVVALHGRVFDASRLSLVVAGEASAQDAVAALEDAFGAMAPGHAARARASKAPASPATAARIVVVDEPGTSIAAIQAGFLAPAAGDPGADATGLAIDLLAHDALGRLTARLRDQLGYAPWIQYDASQLRAGGAVDWRTRVRTDRVAPTLAEADGVVRAFVAQGPTDEELGAVRARYGSSFATSFQSAAGTARAYGTALMAGQSTDVVRDRSQRVAQVTSGGVRAAAARYLDPARMRTIVVGDWAALRGPLLALGWGPIEVRDVSGKVLRTEGAARASR